MEKKTTLLLLLSAVMLSSCVQIIAKTIGLDDIAPTPKQLTVPGKTVVFMGIMHIAKPEYYDNFRKQLTDYQNQGYKFYIEKVGDSTRGKTSIDTLAIRKFRKVTRLEMGVSYANYSYLQAWVKKYQLIDQPSYEKLGLKSYRRVDYYYIDLIARYEEKYGPIALDSCDHATGLRDKYNCSRAGNKAIKTFMNDIIIKARNQLLAQTIVADTSTKIVIVYGKAHLQGLQQELNLLTNNKK